MTFDQIKRVDFYFISLQQPYSINLLYCLFLYYNSKSRTHLSNKRKYMDIYIKLSTNNNITNKTNKYNITDKLNKSNKLNILNK